MKLGREIPYYGNKTKCQFPVRSGFRRRIRARQNYNNW